MSQFTYCVIILGGWGPLRLSRAKLDYVICARSLIVGIDLVVVVFDIIIVVVVFMLLLLLSGSGGGGGCTVVVVAVVVIFISNLLVFSCDHSCRMSLNLFK